MAILRNLAITVLRLAATPASPPPSAITPADQTGHYERS